MDIKPGTLLVSEPLGDDPYFKRSVVLIVEHTDEGDVGFMLNKCLTIELTDLVENFPDGDYTLCLGGPVSPATLHYIHLLGDALVPGAVHITGNLYWGGDFDVVLQLMNNGQIAGTDIKFFLGYAGWSRGQLAKEIEQGDWEICNGYDTAEMICCTDSLWYEIVQKSDKFVGWSVMPQSPYDN